MSKRYRFGIGALLAVVLAEGGVLAGDLTPPGPPGATMYTLEDIYLAVTGDSNVVNTTSGDAVAGEILNDKRAWVKGQEVTGTMPNKGAQNVTPGTSAQAITQGYHDGTGEVAGDTDLEAGNIRSGASIFGVNGTVVQATGNAAAGDVLSGKTFSSALGSSTGTITVHTGDVPAHTGTVSGTTLRLLPHPGYYSGSPQICVTYTDDNFIPGNIKIGVGLFGVGGTLKTAQVPRTGQTTSYRSRDDGALQAGVAWPSPRFTDHGNGTATDNMTGLMWVNAPHSLSGNSGTMTWNNAIDFCNGLSYAGHSDWRLPNVRELHSLTDYARYDLALPSGHPFTGIQSIYYWSSTTFAVNTSRAFTLYLPQGNVGPDWKTYTYGVWPVRAGQ